MGEFGCFREENMKWEKNRVEWRETKNKGLCGVLASNNSQEDKATFSEPL